MKSQKFCGIILLFCLFVLGGCVINEPIKTEGAVIPEEVVEPPLAEPTIIELVAVGDNLIHNTVYQQAAKRAGGKGYDFALVYEQIESYISEADLAFINQETPLATAIAPPASYPRFNSPTELGDELIELGFDVFNHSNNHMLDQKEIGLKATMDYWKEKEDCLVTGVYSNTDATTVQSMNVEGVEIGFVGVTYGANGFTLPQGSTLDYLTFDEEEAIKACIEETKAQCDVVIVSAHWGVENSHKPTEMQRAWAQKFADWGVDLVIGHHSHTLQPIEVIERGDNNPMVVAYSLGNFISAQKGIENMLGGILSVEITVLEGDVEITEVKLIPTVTHYDGGFKDLRIVPWENYDEQLAKQHGINKYKTGFSYGYLEEVIMEVIGEEYI